MGRRTEDGGWEPSPGEYLFRPLTAAEVAAFEAHAEREDPPGQSWSLFHPVCRRVWAARGLREVPGG